MLAAALEAEADAYVAALVDKRDQYGRRLVGATVGLVSAR